jgi:hypothetical protein
MAASFTSLPLSLCHQAQTQTALLTLD